MMVPPGPGRRFQRSAAVKPHPQILRLRSNSKSTEDDQISLILELSGVDSDKEESRVVTHRFGVPLTSVEAEEFRDGMALGTLFVARSLALGDSNGYGNTDWVEDCQSFSGGGGGQLICNLSNVILQGESSSLTL